MENYHKNMITQFSCYHITSCKEKKKLTTAVYMADNG